MADNDGGTAEREWHVAEYSAIKAEQLERIKFRDNLFFAAFVLYGALGAYALQLTAPSDTWLLLGFVSGLAGHIYLENEAKISAIRDYLKKEHRLRLKWETEVDHEKQRGIRKTIQVLIDILAFGGPAIFCTSLVWSNELQILPRASKFIVGFLGLYVVLRTVMRSARRYLFDVAK